MIRPLVVAGLLLSTPALAQPIDLSRGGQIEVTAAGGFEWRDQEQKVIATGDARAVRGTVTVLADKLTALYRKRNATTAPSNDTGSNEIYRLEAEGHVRIVTPTDEAVGDHAIYDIDQAVLVMTGGALRLTTPQQVLTARDSLEYWSDRKMSVARGAAVVVTSDARQVSADTLVGYSVTADQPAAPKPAAEADSVTASKLERVEAFGNVEIRTATDIVRGERGVYLPEAKLARIVGRVRITHGPNQINGPAADVDMNTGIARMIAEPGGRVQGLIVPDETKPGAAKPAPAKPAPSKPAAKP